MAYLDINNVVKRYEGHTALAGVSMQVEQGTIYGLLGPNGAGKSTLIRIINRILAADEGTVTLNGKVMTDDDITHIGYLPEERGLYKKMKVGDQIVYLGRLKGMTKADAVASMHWWLDRFDLKEWENKKVENLSKGMQQKPSSSKSRFSPCVTRAAPSCSRRTTWRRSRRCAKRSLYSIMPKWCLLAVLTR